MNHVTTSHETTEFHIFHMKRGLYLCFKMWMVIILIYCTTPLFDGWVYVKSLDLTIRNSNVLEHEDLFPQLKDEIQQYMHLKQLFLFSRKVKENKCTYFSIQRRTWVPVQLISTITFVVNCMKNSVHDLKKQNRPFRWFSFLQIIFSWNWLTCKVVKD